MKLRAVILAAVLLLGTTPGFSQACSMCYSTARATSKDGQQAISKGVIVLLLPPLSFMTLGVWAAIRYGKRRDLESGSVEQSTKMLIPKSSSEPIFDSRLLMKTRENW
jgi:hypothetical protein